MSKRAYGTCINNTVHTYNTKDMDTINIKTWSSAMAERARRACQYRLESRTYRVALFAWSYV